MYLIDRYMLSMLSLKKIRHTLLFFFNLYFINKLERNFKKIDQGIPRKIFRLGFLEVGEPIWPKPFCDLSLATMLALEQGVGN